MEEVEAVGRAGRVARIECLDRRDRCPEYLVLARQVLGRRVREVREQCEMDMRIHIAERVHLEALDKSPRALDRGNEGGNNDHGPSVFGHAAAQVEARQRPRPRDPVDHPVHERHREFAYGNERERADPDPHPLRCPRRSRRRHRGRHPDPRERGERAEVDGRGMLKHQALQAYRQSGVVGDVALQLAAAASDQVVTYVCGSGIGAQLFRRLTGALDGAQRDPHLGLAGRVCQRLDRVPVAIAAVELHPAVDALWIALEDLFDQADALDVLVPIERGAQPEAGDGVAHREVVHRLSLMLGTHGVLHRRAGGVQPHLQLPPEPGGAGAVLSHPLQQLVHERYVEDLRKEGHAAAFPRALEVGETSIRLEAARAAVDQFLGEPA